MKTNWLTVIGIMAGLADKRLLQQIEFLKEQNQVLKEHIHEKCGTKRICLTDSQRRRLAVKARPLGAKLLGEVCDIFSPDTILGWYRKLVAKKYDGSANRKGGRPKIAKEIIDLVVRMAKDNKSWGHRRIRNYVVYLGHRVSYSSVQRILDDHGLDPNGRPPDRKTTWNQLVRSHMDVIAATDFFTVELLTPRGLVRCMVLFVIDLASRKVEIVGVKIDPMGSG
jgi:putative transposase